MKLEYIILCLLAILFYNNNIKDYIEKRDKERFVNENLKIGSKIMTKSGVIAYVKAIDKNIITIISGNEENYSYFTIEKSYIDHIIS